MRRIPSSQHEQFMKVKRRRRNFEKGKLLPTVNCSRLIQRYGSFPAIVAILECLCSPPSLEKHRVSCYFNNEGCKVIKIFAFPFPVDIKLLYMKDLQTVHFLFINAFNVSTKNHTSKKNCLSAILQATFLIES